MKQNITLKDIDDYLFNSKKIELTATQISEIEKSYNFLKDFSQEKVIYGINTGFGPMAQYRIDDKSLRDLQYNIIRSHSTGAGQPLPDIYVKSAMIARLGTLLCAKSGVNLEAVQILVKFINNNIIPFVPQHGSVGASGDLVQLAHIALTLIGEGKVFYNGQLCNTSEVLKANGITPLKIYIREGLSLTNGTSFMTGIAAVNLHYANKLLQWAILSSAMMNEIAGSYDDMISYQLNAARPHNGQIEIAEIMRRILQSGQRLKKRETYLYDNGHKEQKVFTDKVQAYYSLRCVPQVLGPVLDTLKYAASIVEQEFNSACDNPIIDHESKNVYHGGNFHGDYISLEMDKIKLAITKTTMLAERQMNYLFHSKINEILPPFVNLGTLGLNYGMQAAQFTAVSTTAECQTLSNSMYVHSIPNNNDNQDIVSMGSNSALLTKRVIDNAYQVMAIHYMSLMQAIDCLYIKDKLCNKSREIYSQIREFFPVFKDDYPLYTSIEKTENFLRNYNINL